MINLNSVSDALLASERLVDFHSAVSGQRAELQQHSMSPEKMVACVRLTLESVAEGVGEGKTEIKVKKAEVYRHYGAGGTTALSLRLRGTQASIGRS